MTDVTERISYQEIGSTGLAISGGVVKDAPLKELRGKKWQDTLEEMISTDPVVGAIVFVVDMLVRRVKWDVVPYDDTERSRREAEFVQECLFGDMSSSWEETLSEIMSFLWWGWAYLEIVWKQRLGQVDDPTKRSNYDDGKIGFRKWAIRGQDTLTRWNVDPGGGIAGMYQRGYDYKERYIPIDKALLFRTRSRKNNPEGISMLRTAYRPWFLKRRIENIEAVGAERDLAGLPVMGIPLKYMRSDASEEEKQIRNRMKAVVTSIHRDEQEGLLMPMEYDEHGHELFSLKLLATGGRRQFDTNSMLVRYDSLIAMSVLADFIVMGHARVGSYALAETKTGIFHSALGAWVQSIAAVANEFGIKKLYRVNAGMDARKPARLQPNNVESVDLGELGAYLESLSRAGFRIATVPGLLPYLMRQGKMPIPPDFVEDLPTPEELDPRPVPALPAKSEGKQEDEVSA